METSDGDPWTPCSILIFLYQLSNWFGTIHPWDLNSFRHVIHLFFFAPALLRPTFSGTPHKQLPYKDFFLFQLHCLRLFSYTLCILTLFLTLLQQCLGFCFGLDSLDVSFLSGQNWSVDHFLTKIVSYCHWAAVPFCQWVREVAQFLLRLRPKFPGTFWLVSQRARTHPTSWGLLGCCYLAFHLLLFPVSLYSRTIHQVYQVERELFLSRFWFIVTLLRGKGNRDQIDTV